jgi:hypothetical protein
MGNLKPRHHGENRRLREHTYSETKNHAFPIIALLTPRKLAVSGSLFRNEPGKSLLGNLNHIQRNSSQW